jgi:hypothetical protein
MKKEEVRTWRNCRKIASSKYRLRRRRASSMGTMVKREMTSKLMRMSRVQFEVLRSSDSTELDSMGGVMIDQNLIRRIA